MAKRKKRRRVLPPRLRPSETREIETGITVTTAERDFDFVSLDLHGLSPDEAESTLLQFLDGAFARGILRITIIHGKGRGRLCKRVRSVLTRSPLVKSFSFADPFRGSYGATEVWLEC